MKLIIHDFPPRLFNIAILINIRPCPAAAVFCGPIGK
jgi:hypothetical protein|tara:strand:- start:71 stop:181 length:111 start_codon:yes stop_codon:yes gene_type:complete